MLALVRYNAQQKNQVRIDMQALNAYLSQAVRRLRQERGWSLDVASQHTGVSKAMLGQIERGESSPTLATLWKIASGFNTSMSTFIEPDLSCSEETLHRSADKLRHQPATDQMLVAPLFPFEIDFGFEVFELTLLPGYQRYSEPHAPGVVEHVIVIKGQMELLADGKWQALRCGEAMRFAADKPHGYRNLTDNPAVFHNIIHYPRT